MDVRDVIAWVLAGVNVWLLLRHFHLVRQLARVNASWRRFPAGITIFAFACRRPIRK
jgi:hypothetical protein